MADTNYIGVAMGMDVTDLKAGLSEANKQIQLANSEFKAAASGMDDWTKSTEGITAKVKQLDSVLKMQKSKLAGLTAEYEKVVAEQGEGSDAAQKLKVQINNQQAVVNKTEKEFKNYSETLEKAEAGLIDLESVSLKAGKAIEKTGDSANDASEKVGDLGDKAGGSSKIMSGLGGVAKGVGAGILAVGGAAVGAAGSFLSLAESTRETRENMAKLETGFTTAGHTAESASETYRELYSVLGDEGQATEAAAHLALLANNQEDLSSWTNIATGVYATFGASLPIESLTEAANETAKTGEITGSLADALNWAGVSEEEFQDKLDGASSEQERQAIITETLNGLYSEQADQFKELNGDIMASRDADAQLAETMAELGAIAEPIMTTLKVLAVDLLNSIKPFVELLGTGLQGVLQGNAGAADTLAEGLGGILGKLVEIVSGLLPTFLSVVVNLVDQIIGVLAEQLPFIITTILRFLPRVIESILTLVPLLIETLGEIISQILKGLGEFIPVVIGMIISFIPILIEKLLAAIPLILQAAIQLLMAIVQAIPTLINNLLVMLPSVLNTIIQFLASAIPMLLQSAIQLLNAIVQAIPVIIQSLIQNLPTIIDTIITGLLNALPQILEAAITLLMAIIQAIPEITSQLLSSLPTLIVTIVGCLLKAIPQILSTAVTLLSQIVLAIPKIIKQIPSNIAKVVTGIVDGLKKGISKVKDVGKNIIEGLWNGIKDMTSWIGDKIKGFGESVLGGLKSFFGIASPSKVMRDEIGQWIGKGIGEGIIDSVPAVKKNIDKFSNFVSDNLGTIKSGLSLENDLGYAGGGSSRNRRNGGNGGYTVVNAGMTVNYNGSLSRKELKKIENDHYKSVKSKLKEEGAIK